MPRKITIHHHQSKWIKNRNCARVTEPSEKRCEFASQNVLPREVLAVEEAALGLVQQRPEVPYARTETQMRTGRLEA